MGRLSKLSDKHGKDNVTFVFEGEGYSLGHSLAAVINDYSGIKLCGCTVPHPTDNRMYLHLHTTGEDAIEVLKRGLKDLEKICDITIERFEKEYEEFKKNAKDTT